MIKVKIYTDNQYFCEVSNWCAGDAKEYTNRTFDALAPFRDFESINFLKTVYDIEFIENDWFSVLIERKRCSIYAFDDDIKYVLSLIYFSQKQIYLSYRSLSGEIWDFLEGLSFDILIVTRMSELAGCYHSLCGPLDYRIINYPYQQLEIEVTIKKHLKGTFYRAVEGARKFNTNYGLYIGEDNRYYSDIFGIATAFRYYWKNDIENIISYIDNGKKKIYLMSCSQELTIFQFGKLIGEDAASTVGWDEEHGDYLKEVDNAKEYEHYLWLRDKLKIVNYMYLLPDDILYRKLPILCVDKNKDNSYYISGDLTIKNPTYMEIMEGIWNMCCDDYERFALIINKDEILDSVQDIENALCGFKISKNKIEIYDADKAIELFGECLRKAYYSGNCTISDDFY